MVEIAGDEGGVSCRATLCFGEPYKFSAPNPAYPGRGNTNQ